MATCKRCLAPKLSEQPCRRCGCWDNAAEAQTMAMCVERGCGNEATRVVDLVQCELIGGEIVDVSPGGRKFYCEKHMPTYARPLPKLDAILDHACE